MSDKPAFTSVRFRNYKALEDFAIDLRHLNILVGPNNCGKSSILGAFRVLANAIRRARSRKPEPLYGPNGPTHGYFLATRDFPISLENVHTNLRETDTDVVFRLSNKTELTLYFPKDGGCMMTCRSDKGVTPRTAAAFKSACPLEIDYVPVLGPLEYDEQLVEKETVRVGATTHRASRHFRSYWYYNAETFPKFAELLKKSWPGMEVESPIVTYGDPTIVHMLCKEQRLARELYWAGFGFQVWCQLLTHLTRAADTDLLVVDEPEIYLHPELQRQLVYLLREAGPDVILATHSTEMIGEADPSDIVLIDKRNKKGQRIVAAEKMQLALDILGSNQNLTLTQLARNRKILFVEGKDYPIIRAFARLLEKRDLANGTGLTVVQIEGFSNWDMLPSVAWGFEKALSQSLALAVVLDRDYRCDEEVESIVADLSKDVACVHIHNRKEIENFVLVLPAIQRTVERLVNDRNRRYPEKQTNPPDIAAILQKVTDAMRDDVCGQYQAKKADYFAQMKSKINNATLNSQILNWFNSMWTNLDRRMDIVPGKDVLSALNKVLQEEFGISVTPAKIIATMKLEEVPTTIQDLISKLELFRVAT